MHVPLSWLREFINIDLHPQQIARALTMLGLEVDAVTKVQPNFSNVIVGEVLSCEKHPYADTLKVVQVSDGEKVIQVVCGAPNCREGIKAALAPSGALLEEDTSRPFAVIVAKLRGIASHGMLCSSKELGIGNDDEGIIEFASLIAVGADVAQMYTDTFFDISLTPNMGHCASIYGVARELSGALGIPLKEQPKAEGAGVALGDVTPFDIDIQQPSWCPRYCCRLLRGVTVEASPQWLQFRLGRCGLRPVNNVVDVTNYVMVELGQPLHAFDAAKLCGKTIIVRRAADGEEFEALDGTMLRLCADDTVIADEAGPIALAGVIGGARTKVDEQTKQVLLECASFEPATIRRTARRYGLATDASARFEKGVDAEALPLVIERATALAAAVTGGSATAAVSDSYPGRRPVKVNSCRLDRVQQLLGITIGSGEVEELLGRQGIVGQWDEANEVFTGTIPSWRRDLQIEADLVEEVARMYGYESLPRLAAVYSIQRGGDDPLYLFSETMRQLLVGQGLQEPVTCDLIGPKALQKSGGSPIGDDALVSIINPVSVDYSMLRISLLPTLLQVVRHNIDHQERDIAAFDLGRVHFKTPDGRYVDQDNVGIVLTGARDPSGWDNTGGEVDFYDVKGIVEDILELLHIKGSWQPCAMGSLHPGRQASLWHEGIEIGVVGEVHPLILQQWDIKQPVVIAELSLKTLYKVQPSPPKMEPLPQYPASQRDWTVTLDEEVSVQRLWDAQTGCCAPLLKECELVNVYRGGKVSPGQKNVNLRFTYRDDSKTVEGKAVDAEHEKVIQNITERLRER